MPRSCTICSRPSRNQIDAAFVSGESFQSLARRFGESRSALVRHTKSHLSDAVASRPAPVSRTESLVHQIDELKTKARSILDKAESQGDLRTALAGIQELARLIELLAKLSGELRPAQLNILQVERLDPDTARLLAETYLARHPKEASDVR
jgi:hypothetical protein